MKYLCCVMLAWGITVVAADAKTRTKVKPVEQAKEQTCEASVYGEGKWLANGERFNKYEPLMAHRTAPLGSKMRVTNLRNGKSIVIPVKDRGPYAFTYKRCVDLSYGAADQIGFGRGIGMVRIEPL